MKALIDSLYQRFLSINELTLELKALARMLSNLLLKNTLHGAESKALECIGHCLFFMDQDFDFVNMVKQHGLLFDETTLNIESIRSLFSLSLIDYYVELTGLLDQALRQKVDLSRQHIDELLCLSSILFAVILHTWV